MPVTHRKHTPDPPIPQGQFCSLDEAKAFADMVTAAGIAGGAERFDDSNGYVNTTSGVYLDAWDATFDPRPSFEGKLQYLLRYRQLKPDGSHVEGFNIGLYMEMASGHTAPPLHPTDPPNPINWKYAVEFARKEAADQLAEASQ